jgi:hypothetical protein
MEDPLDGILVVGSSEDLLDNELAGSGDNGRVISEIGVLEKNAVILLVDADGVLNLADSTSLSGHKGIEIVDRALAVATQSETVGEITGTVFTEIESVLALMGVLRVSVWDNHLGKGHSVEDGANVALVVEGNVVQDNTFSVVEANVELPVLPLNLAASARHLEGDTLGLGDVDGLQVGPVATLLLDGKVVVLDRGFQSQRATDLGNVDGNNLLLNRVPDGAEVQRVLVLAVVDVRAEVHQSLLKSNVAAESLIVTNGPRITVDLVHLIAGNTANNTLLDDLGVDSASVLDSGKLFDSDNGLGTVSLLPLGDARPRKIDETLPHLAARSNDYHVCNTGRSGIVLRVGEPRGHDSLARLLKRDDMEVDFAIGLLNDANGNLDFHAGERVEGVREVDRHGEVVTSEDSWRGVNP